MDTATMKPEDQHLLNLVKLAPLSEDRKQKLEQLIPEMTDNEKLKLLSIVTTQIVMQMQSQGSVAVEKTLQEMASNPNKPYDPKAFNEAVNQVWNDFMAKNSKTSDDTQIDSLRASLQALQDKLKKISNYAEEAENELKKHL